MWNEKEVLSPADGTFWLKQVLVLSPQLESELSSIAAAESEWCLTLSLSGLQETCPLSLLSFLRPSSSERVGLKTEFLSEKIPRNRLGTVSAEESTHSEAFRVPRKSQFRSLERNGMEFREKISFTQQQQNNLTKWFVCTSKVVFSW